jgi:hypothetical protein
MSHNYWNSLRDKYQNLENLNNKKKQNYENLAQSNYSSHYKL